jgi:hypothetical protein
MASGTNIRPEKGYEAPVVTDFGDLVDLTAQQSTGGFTDRTFPANTPKSDLTFSG